MSKYLSLTVAGFKERISFRAHFICSFLSNIMYIGLVYYLWKAIFNSSTSTTINGMNFMTTFVYLSIANAMTILMQSWVEWDMSRDILNGKIVFNLARPINFQRNIFFTSLGIVVSNFVTIFLPTFLVIIILVRKSIGSVYSVPVYVISLMLAIGIHFTIDFIIGVVAFHTENIWGISTTKDVLVALLSGALIPLPFFPETLQRVVKLLPFQAIYNVPIQILTNKSFCMKDYMFSVGLQIFWLLILWLLGQIMYQYSVKVITVNGG